MSSPAVATPSEPTQRGAFPPAAGGARVRRRQLLGLVGGAAAVATAGQLPALIASAAPLPDDLFTLGVASGDPYHDSVVIWTRLAADPVALDGHGGMPPRRVPVQWEVADDPKFTRVRRSGTQVTDPAWAHAVHVVVEGLRPDREYWYRFRVGQRHSPIGRTRTAPVTGAKLQSLDFAFVSCQNYPAGHFTALDHLAKAELDVVLHLGDYIYEGPATGSIGRAHLPASEIFSLADYRVRYGQYKSDPSLMAAHASAPWATIPDDHEVENNWAGDISQIDDEPDQDPAVFRQRRAAAFHAYYEHLPLRPSSKPRGPAMQIYRGLSYGQLAEFSMLDTRQYRSDQLEQCQGDCPERWDPARTYLGDAQEAWLLNRLGATAATWKVIGNQAISFGLDKAIGEDERYPTDNWNGYPAARRRLYEGVRDRGVGNLVMVTGDAHRNSAANLHLDFHDPASPIIGTEFLGTSVSSGGNGLDTNPGTEASMAENPHIKFINKQRGFQRVHLTPDRCEVDYLVVPYVTEPGAPITRRARAIVETGRPGIAAIEEPTGSAGQ